MSTYEQGKNMVQYVRESDRASESRAVGSTYEDFRVRVEVFEK